MKILHIFCALTLWVPLYSTSLDVEEQFRAITQQFSEVEGALSVSMPVRTTLFVSQAPLVISEPGKYNVISDLVYGGTGAAITVTSDNVSINFHRHSLTLQNSNATGILVHNVNNFTLENSIIEGSATTALQLQQVANASVNSLYARGCQTAVQITNSQQVQISYSQFEDGTGLSIDSSSHVALDSSTLSGNNADYGVHITGTSEDIALTESSFINFLSAICALQVDGLLVDHCQATSAASNALNLVQLGSTVSESNANDVIIKNSTFTQLEAITGFDGILILAGSSCFLENLIVDSSSQDPAQGALPSAVHIGYQDISAYENLIAKNCIFKGKNGRSVFIENGQKIIIDSCQISNASLYNLQMQNATSCTVKNCMIFDGDTGVYIDNSAGGGNNSVKECFIANNTTCGINVLDMAKNSILANSVWGSQTGIQIAYSLYTESFYNTACNNSEQNCSNVYPSQLPGGTPPGTPLVAGANICCEP